MARENAYYDIVRRSEIKEESRKLRRLFLRYKEAEIVYSIQHKKLLELAGKAGAIYRIDGTVLINRDIFEDYLEQFHEKSTMLNSLDTAEYSFAYIAGWSSGKEVPELRASLQTIRDTADELITEIDGRLAEISRERESRKQGKEQPCLETLARMKEQIQKNPRGRARTEVMER